MNKKLVLFLTLTYVAHLSHSLNAAETKGKRLYFSDWQLLNVPETPIARSKNVIFNLPNHRLTLTIENTITHNATPRTGEIDIFIPYEKLSAMQRALKKDLPIYIEAHGTSHLFKFTSEDVVLKK